MSSGATSATPIHCATASSSWARSSASVSYTCRSTGGPSGPARLHRPALVEAHDELVDPPRVAAVDRQLERLLEERQTRGDGKELLVVVEEHVERATVGVDEEDLEREPPIGGDVLALVDDQRVIAAGHELGVLGEVGGQSGVVLAFLARLGLVGEFDAGLVRDLAAQPVEGSNSRCSARQQGRGEGARRAGR